MDSLGDRDDRFLGLTLSGHFEGWLIALIVSSLVWYTVVPRATSR